jgi:hypothetical protein
VPRRDPNEKREADNAYVRRRNQGIRDIAEKYPGPGDRARRDACGGDFRRFCETYFPKAFRLAWSDDHLRVIARMQDAVLHGGLFALAMPRGAGKTTLSIRAAMWAILYGHRRFVCLVGATEKRAGELLKHIKVELTYNETLVADFRHVCYPLARLENNARRCVGQTFDGQQTRIEWAADRLTLPTMPAAAVDGVDVSGSTISVVGLTGALRGQSSTLPNGEIIRPELVILDDPQTRESAMSANQSETRADIVNGDVLGMAGPDRTIAAIMPCTVIRAGDMADRLLDRQQSPRWKGEKLRMLYSLPVAEGLWEEYKRIRDNSLQSDGDGSEATAFYAARRAEMDAGAVAGWQARFEPGQLSAIEHAMALKLDDEAMFAAEYQNEPIPPDQGDALRLTPALVSGKVSGIKRGVVPFGSEHLTAFVDVHDTLLYYAVTAWTAEFTGWVVDYGTWPAQHLRYFTMRKVARTLPALYPGAGREGAIRAGLDSIGDALLSREFVREDGAVMRVGRCLVDSGYVPEVVHEACRRSPHAAVLMPSRGVGIAAKGRPIADYDRSKGDRIGFNWYIHRVTDRRSLRTFRHDVNFWKSFTAARLATAAGDVGCLSLYGKGPDEHRMIADHCCAETPTRTYGQGRSLDEWSLRPEKPDNHLWDCLVGCTAAASFSGAALPGAQPKAAPAKRRRLTMAEMRERPHARP